MITEGAIVTIVGKLDNRIKDNVERTGTVWALLANKQVLVILGNGDLHKCDEYNLVEGEIV